MFVNNFQKIIFISIFINLSFIYSNKIVILPFNELTTDNQLDFNISSISKLFENQYKNKIYTVLKIGTPEQSMMCFINSDNNIFSVGSQENCYSKSEYNYSISDSLSSKIVDKIEGDDYFPGYAIINETIQLYTDISLKRLEEIQNFQIRYEEPKKSWGSDDYTDKIFCGQIGFQLNQAKNTWAKFIKQLKNANIINSYVLTMEYNSENSGFFYIGEYPHIYNPNNYKKKQLMTTYAIPKTSFAQFRILMDNIYIMDYNNETKFILKNNEVYFHIELGLIEGPFEYYNYIKNYFFNKYFENNICYPHSLYYDNNYYNITICEDNENFKIDEFPILFFYHKNLNLTFSLDYKDLFKKINNKYFFLVSYSSFSGYYWKLGKPFLKKYQITLNLDAKTISFYNLSIKDDNEENNSKIENFNNESIILIIICFLLSVALFVVTIYFTIQLKGKRKKRANELTDDNYDYFIQDNEEKNEPNPYSIIKKIE